MELYGKIEHTRIPRLTLVSLHSGAVAVSGWMLLFGGIETIAGAWGIDAQPAPWGRRAAIFACAFVYLLRTAVTALVLLQRRMEWSEATTIAVFVSLVHGAIAWLGGTSSAPLGVFDALLLACYLLGSYLNTASEAMRYVWKKDPANKGKLYTEGLFAYAMHINYFGDFLLFSAYALLGHSPWLLIIPVLVLSGFVFANIPMLDRYLAERYGEQFTRYAAKTKKLVPFVY